MEIKREEFYAPVEKVPMKEYLPTWTFSSYNDTAVLVHWPGEDDPRCVNVCSEGYGLIDNSQFFGKLEESLSSEKFDSKYFLFGSGLYFTIFHLPERETTIGKDRVVPVVFAQNSYNSRILQGTNHGFFLPDEGIYVLGSVLGSTLFSHVEGSMDDEGLDGEHLYETLEDVISEQKSQLQTLSKKKVPIDKDFIEALILQSRFYKVVEMILEQFEGKKSVNAWTFYKAMLYHVYNDKVSSSFNVRASMDSRLLYILENLKKTVHLSTEEILEG